MKVLILVLSFLFINVNLTDEIPSKIYEMAKRNQAVYLESHDDNAVIHLKNAIESWGYWKVVDNKSEADFMLKIYLRFEGAGVCITNATFINPKTDNVVYSTEEVTSVKQAKGFDFNTKRSAMRQLVEQIFKPNFQ
ncbi:MAG: hypothetical protein KQH79_02010 [Bacteroidetes bacterium]|nr:hypothetical protein [Bacteroidota bacterium]